MRLKSIEIRGFKSFANPTQIHFEEDIIGIVGPNGSGKSNIIDAIRWVLGEQKTRELRLDSMSDVLFNGTKQRRASNSAQVTIHFDNTKNLLASEYTEVAITRTLYRSGDSEYRINDVTCRLKDIRNLFFDSGIGSNSYAIIALGMVDELLADREGARRMMFEQAAGISKYKQQKKETIQKLKQTADDLERLEDLVFEIEKNLKVLERQAKRAKKYLTLQQQYKSLAVSSASWELHQLKGQATQVLDKIDGEKEKIAHFTSKLREQEAQIQRKKKALIDTEYQVSKEQRLLHELLNNTRRKEEAYRAAEQKLQYLINAKQTDSKQSEKLKLKQRELSSSIESKKKQIQLSEKEYTEAAASLEVLAAQVEEFQEKHNTHKTELDALNKEYRQAESTILNLEKEQALVQNNCRNYQQQIQILKKDFEIANSKTEELSQTLVAHKQDREQILQRIDAVEEQLQESENTKEKILQKKSSIDQEINQLNRSIDAKTNEQKLLKDMIERMEGFPESNKFLSKSRESWTSDFVLLSDLLHTEKKYVVALELYLEKYLNYFVVDTYEEALRGAELLHDNQKGRTGFLVRESFRGIQTKPKQTPYQWAGHVIQTQPKDEPLLYWLLKDAYFVEADDYIIEGNVEEDMVLLSPSGKFIRERHALSGGSVGLFDGKKIGRAKTLEALNKSIKTLRTKVESLEVQRDKLLDQLQEVSNQDQLKQELKQLNHKLSHIDQQIVRSESDIQNKRSHYESAESKIRDLEEKLMQSRSRESELITAQTSENLQFQKLREKTQDLNSLHRDVTEKFGQLKESYNQQNISTIRLQNQLKNLQQEYQFAKDRHTENADQLAEISLRLDNNEGDQMKVLAEKEALEVEIEELKAQRSSNEGKLSKSEKEYFAAKGEITEMEDATKVWQKNINTAQQVISQIKEKHMEIQLERNKIIERLRIEFKVEAQDIHLHTSTKISAEEQEELVQKVQKIREQLNNFGEVNPLAVDAYEEMQTRYNNIIEQRDDVIKAKTTLLETIEEIETTAVTKFIQAFTQVKENFQQVFRTLFTQEDTCDLVLINPEDPLTSGIEIIAKPKGKRPKTLAQLSGGEKTLTAIALLFALYLLKPAPFCIFDEVDAPLDDTNIVKFNKIIREFSDQSQFIIVTHNKLTMAAVDVIYGVYMEKTGISNVSAVDFRQLDHQLELIPA